MKKKIDDIFKWFTNETGAGREGEGDLNVLDWAVGLNTVNKCHNRMFTIYDVLSHVHDARCYILHFNVKIF